MLNKANPTNQPTTPKQTTTNHSTTPTSHTNHSTQSTNHTKHQHRPTTQKQLTNQPATPIAPITPTKQNIGENTISLDKDAFSKSSSDLFIEEKSGCMQFTNQVNIDVNVELEEIPPNNIDEQQKKGRVCFISHRLA